MANRYRVTAPYVTLKVKDGAGGEVVVGYYEGAVVENVAKESVDAHLESEMIEKLEDPEPAKPTRQSHNG